MAKFRIRSKRWDIFTLIGSVALVVLGFGGLVYLQSANASAAMTLGYVAAFGVLTFLFFAGPGLLFVARKRLPWVKKRMPGGTLTWIRAHLYLPVLAIVGGWVHATVVPFRNTLSSGKLLLAVGVVVSVAGVARHHLIGVQKAAVNATARITKITSRQPRRVRQMVQDFQQERRPLEDLRREAAELPDDQRAAWDEVLSIQRQIDQHFPLEGGQARTVRVMKVARALHAPLTVLLFALLVVHIWDVFGGTEAVLGDERSAFAAAATCAECHGAIFEEWASSSMAHAQTSTIMEAQLPVTLARNAELAAFLGPSQQALFEAAAPTCINCHAPIGASFVTDPGALLPLDAAPPGGDRPVSGGGDAVNADGIACIVCHTQSEPLSELAGLAPIPVDGGGAASFGTMHGPDLTSPNALPVWVHGVDSGSNGFWNDPIAASTSCGACHNVKVDLDGDGLSPLSGIGDADGDFQLDENELDIVEGALEDLILQTTFDEWQDYLVGFRDRFERDPRPRTDRPLGCVECHMPAQEPAGLVDQAPGFLGVPDRPRRSHTFIGVDYDLDPETYTERGLPPDVVNDVLAERRALLQTAVRMRIEDTGVVAGTVYTANVVVQNNLLGHSFPTGFAFARQAWFEVTARTASGEPVCLLDPEGLGDGPCGSGVIADRIAPLPECDPDSLAAVLGVDRQALPNGDIFFADALPAGQCDPWLSNFQKILTDGDPDRDGFFREVPYQSFLADIVKTRERVISARPMDALQPVRLKENQTGGLDDDSFASLDYDFDTSRIPDGERITVTATLKFRHLPPEFVRGLEAELDELRSVPAEARIDAEELLANLVVTDVVTATSGEDFVIACEGPQNRPGASLLDCVSAVAGDGAVALGELHHEAVPVKHSAVVGGLLLAGVLLLGGRLGRRGGQAA